MRATRRLLLLIALWAGVSSAVAAPAHATQVQQCRQVSGRFVLSPGLSAFPANQVITAHGRLTGCSSGGGSATFAATIDAANVTCATFAGGLLPAEMAFGWADGQSTIASLALSSPPGSPNKVLLFGHAVSGAARGSRVEGGLRLSVEVSPAGAKPFQAHVQHSRGRQALVPLVSKANACSPRSPITTIDVSNFEGFALGTPKARPAPMPAVHPVTPGSTHPTVTTASGATTTTVAPGSSSSTTTSTTKPIIAIRHHVKPRHRAPGVKLKQVAVGGLGSPASNGSSFNAESILGAGVAGGSIFVIGLLFFRRSRLVRTSGRSARAIR
jgi:hypothetical protein